MHLAAQTGPDPVLPDLSGGGRYDSVEIGGFVLPVTDVSAALAAGLLTYDRDRGRFRFGPAAASERAVRAELAALPLRDPRAVRDLYRATRVALPNGAAHVLTVPSGYGPAVFANQREGMSLGLGLGGVARVPYTTDPDAGLSLGLAFGNAFETAGVVLGLAINDLSDPGNTDRYAAAVQVSRYVGDGLSVAIGGDNLFVRDTDSLSSGYVVGSWAFDSRGALPFDGVATLGAGTGRFARKTARDRAEGKGRDATVVFGALAWEITDSATLITDWNGRNLSIGGAVRVPFSPVSVRLGLRDLTDTTGDGARLFGSVGVTLARF